MLSVILKMGMNSGASSDGIKCKLEQKRKIVVNIIWGWDWTRFNKCKMYTFEDIQKYFWRRSHFAGRFPFLCWWGEVFCSRIQKLLIIWLNRKGVEAGHSDYTPNKLLKKTEEMYIARKIQGCGAWLCLQQSQKPSRRR